MITSMILIFISYLATVIFYLVISVSLATFFSIVVYRCLPNLKLNLQTVLASASRTTPSHFSSCPTRPAPILASDSVTPTPSHVSSTYTSLTPSAPPLVAPCEVCFSSSKVRCSRCRLARYCSAKCQIIHWRNGHKKECRPLAAARQHKNEERFFDQKTTNSLRQSEEASSSKVDDSNSSETVRLCDPDVLVCPICFENLSIPVYQCINGHLLCSHCSVRVKDFCPTCNSQSEHYRCRGIEKILESAKSACPNKKYGCEMIIPWIDKLAHESACLFTPCCCPISNCTFIGTPSQLSYKPSQLSYHVSRNHNNILLFTHGKTLRAKLSRDMGFRVLVEKEMEINVFVLHNQRRVDGNAFSISATGYKQYLYKLEVKHGERTQSIKAPTEIVQRVKADYEPTHDMVVPDSYFNSLGEIELKIKVYPSEKHN